eukprot:SAG22_NODE_987_length_6142_cov_3.152242_6_plen_42_part_00
MPPTARARLQVSFLLGAIIALCCMICEELADDGPDRDDEPD